MSLPALASNPSTPQNLRTQIYSTTAAELFWNASADSDGITAYRIYIAGSLFREVPGTSLFLDVLHPGQRYDFQVSAIDGKGNESQWSSIRSIMTGGSAQAAVAPSENAGDSVGQPVSTPVTAPVVEDVEASAQSTQPATPVTEQAAEPTANSPIDQIETTEPVQGVDEVPTIQAPVELQVVEQTDSSVSIVWEPAADSIDVAGYNLYLGTSYIATSRQNSFTVRGLDADSSYRLFVTAFDFAGNFSTRSEELLLSTLPAGATPVFTEAESQETMAEETLPEQDTEGAAIEEEESAISEQSNSDADAGSELAVDTSDGHALPEPLTIDPDDFFGHSLESDSEAALSGAAPTTPKNLRANLIGNDWVELNWAPSNDDGSVVEYRIHRDDGVVYSISAADESSDVETSQTIQNFWTTTTFTDCNFTHVSDCSDEQTTPEVGALHTYRVSAVDDQGNESGLSDPLSVKLHEEQGAEVQRFTDPYLDGDDEFLFVTDLSNTANFLDQFDLVFADEFQSDGIDPEKWSTRLTWNQSDNVINGEMQYFVDILNNPDFGYNPFILNGETLTIAAIPTPPELSEQALGQPFLSGALSSHEMRSGQLDSDGELITDKFATTYGYVEGRIRVGQIPGMLSSFYLFRRWAGEHAPEIDIIEYLGENPYGEEKAFQTYHYRDVSHGEILSSPTMQFPRESGLLSDEIDLDGFHTYSVLWEPNLVIWYINGQEVQRLTGRQIARQSMNIIVYLVAGSAWAPRPADNAPFPLEIEVDYIRAYKRQPWANSTGG